MYKLPHELPHELQNDLTLRILGNFKKIPDMLGFDRKHSDRHPKDKF